MKNVGLDKRKLKNVAIDEIDDNYISQIEADIKYFVTAKIININKFSILVISFFKNSNIKYRVFIDKKNKEYISQDYTEDVNKPKWRTAKIENLILKYHYNWWEKCLIIKSSGEKILKYLNKNKNPLLSIDEFQNHILKEKLRIKNQKIIDRIDEQMKMVPKLPKSFSKWINDTVLLSSRYIYYKYKRGNKPMEGYCTHCKQNVLVNKPRHNAKGTCPNCKSKIIFKATGKSKNVSDKGYCTIIQKVKTGLVIRYFSVSKHYSNYKNPELYIGENLRDFYEDNSTKVKEYEYRYFKQTGDLRWCEGILTGFWTCPYNFENIVLYTRNLTKVLQKTRWKYSQIKQFAAYKNKDGFNVYRYIESYKRYPFIEYL
ncbi:MAG: hypothetical protein GX954_08995, partial [Clostridium cochlearium]|nr:hypothetical protein [Clostridium cochlearium]